MTDPARESEFDPERVVIRDKRKVRSDATGAAADPAAAPAAGAATADAAPGPAAVGEDARLLAERTADLQRVQAEFANYRRRAERERLAAGEVALGGFLAALLPVLDDVDRARVHGDLTGALKSVADGLETVLTKAGVERFGDVGDPFDPTIHEAVTHDERDDVAVATATLVLRPGYRLGERLLRPAMVGVSDPSTPPATHPATAVEPDASATTDEPLAATADEPVTDDPGTRSETTTRGD